MQFNPDIDRQEFLDWRTPRVGSLNPENMTNPVWDWLIRSRLSGFQANEHFKGPSPFQAGPCWSFNRFGQSSTQLPDGRVIFVAGEHEDHYDPDFYIYNDVVVQYPDGNIVIFGYPHEIFPPTDFHSATLVGNRIIIIGNLGYPQQRKHGTTQIYALDIGSFSISKIETSGASPGWIHGQNGCLGADGSSILITGGLLERGNAGGSLVENLDDWRWERLTERRWRRWELKRADGKPNHLWEFEMALWKNQHPDFNKGIETLTPTLKEQIGIEPDLGLFKTLFQPEISHEVLKNRENEYGVHRIEIAGVVVRYVRETYSVQITIEGNLPSDIVEGVVADLRGKLSALENAGWELDPL